MADAIDTLKTARESFVRKRRTMAEQMVPAGAAGSHFAPAFIQLQAAIEALDRAIADEEALPAGYAAPEPGAGNIGLSTVDGESVDRDYDPA